MSSFGTWNGVEPWPIFDGVGIHAVGGDQVLLCRARYEPGTTVRRHRHDDTEQVMLILDGSLNMTIGDETRHLVAGDVAVVNRSTSRSSVVRSQRGISRRVTRPTARITNTSTTFRPTTQRSTTVNDPVLSRTAPSANGASAAIV